MILSASAMLALQSPQSNQYKHPLARIGACIHYNMSTYCRHAVTLTHAEYVLQFCHTAAAHYSHGQGPVPKPAPDSIVCGARHVRAPVLARLTERKNARCPLENPAQALIHVQSVFGSDKSPQFISVYCRKFATSTRELVWVFCMLACPRCVCRYMFVSQMHARLN